MWCLAQNQSAERLFGCGVLLSHLHKASSYFGQGVRLILRTPFHTIVNLILFLISAESIRVLEPLFWQLYFNK